MGEKTEETIEPKEEEVEPLLEGYLRSEVMLPLVVWCAIDDIVDDTESLYLSADDFILEAVRNKIRSEERHE